MSARGWILFAAMSVIWGVPYHLTSSLTGLLIAAPIIAAVLDRMTGGERLSAVRAVGICTALAFVSFFALIREVGPTRALIFTYVNPAVALLAGVVILREPLTWWNIVGLGLILAGSLLATRAGTTPASERAGNQ